MLCNVKLFGPMREAAGRPCLTIELSEGADCATLRGQIANREPRLVALLPATRFAVNQRLVEEGHQLADGDEIALIGMVSGG